MFRSHILNLPITVHHLHCLISGQISSLFYLSDNIVELCRIAWIFWNNILDILVTAQGRRPSHHLHYSISGQISLLFYHSDKISELELGRIAWIFFSSLLTPQRGLHTPVCSTLCIAGWEWCCWWADSWPWLWRVGWSWPAVAESPSKPPAPAPRRPGTDKGAAMQQWINLVLLSYVLVQCMAWCLNCSQANRPGPAGAQ